uniref:CCAAT-binding factor domain-containing protein n=1 Tax=Graphocephala atropunctata TaxID=36148 RepID=A0A1B6LK40_9HEMI
MLRILEVVLIQRRKKITQQRLLALTKRLSVLATQLLHNGAVGALSVVRRVMQLGMGADVLLDVDSSLGQGIYSPELEEPEHCNAASSALWELTLLQRHYHPAVRMVAQHITTNDNNHTSQMPTEIAKLDSVQLFEHFDPSLVMFKPAVPPPPKNISGMVKAKEDSTFVQELEKSVHATSQPKLSSLHSEILRNFRELSKERRK